VKTGATTSLSSYTPTTVERTVLTNIVAKNDEIVVLGGLVSENSNSQVNKTVCLGDIPILGWLFKSRSDANSKTNLLVYIRPRIVRSEEERALVKLDSEDNYKKANDGNVFSLVQGKVSFGVAKKTVRKLEDVTLFMQQTNGKNFPSTESVKDASGQLH